MTVTAVEPTAINVITGSLGGRSKKFGIDPEQFALIMHLLTKMYPNQERAVVREYSCNAIDEHIKAGQTRPIEVRLPTYANPYFEVEDWGSGLSADEIFGVYCMYGTSTKRGDTSTIGKYGLGCKSALAYTNSFTVISVKDGQRVQVAVTKDVEDVGVATIVDESGTSDPNGVLVRVPVDNNDIRLFEQEAKNIFRFWRPGTVLVNGVEPDHWVGEEISSFSTDKFKAKVHIGDDLDKSYVVMGYVAYPIKDTHYSKVKYIAYVSMDSVELSPNREELIYDVKTNNVLTEVVKHLNKALVAKATKEINGAATPADAWNARKRWADRLGSSHAVVQGLTWNGKQFPSEFRLDPIKDSAGRIVDYQRFIEYRPNVSRYAVDGTKTYTFYAQIYAGVVVYNYAPDGTISSTNKLKIRQYCKDQGWSPNYVYLFKDKPVDPWLAGTRMVDWQDIAAIKLVPGQSGGGSGSRKLIPGSWEQYVKETNNNNYTHTKEITVLDTTKPIIYVSPVENRRERRYGCQDRAYLDIDKLPKDAQFLSLPKNRWDKFKKQFPMALHMKDWIRQEFNKFLAGLTPDEKIQLGMASGDREILKRLDPAAILDPTIANAARVAKLADKVTPRCNTLYSMSRDYMAGLSVSVGGSAYFKKYVMVGGGYHYNNFPAKHIVAYINAIYTLDNTPQA